MFIGIQNEPFKDFNRCSLARSSSLSNGRRLLQPSLPTVVVPRILQSLYFFMGPRTHTDGFASVTNGLMGSLAFVANKRQELDANRGETKLFLLSTVGTDCVARGSSEFADTFFGTGRHGRIEECCCVVAKGSLPLLVVRFRCRGVGIILGPGHSENYFGEQRVLHLERKPDAKWSVCLF